MPTAYADVLEHLRALGPELAPTSAGAAPRKFDLAHMRVLMNALGNPQASFAAVLIAGTNGKGSTAATLASILTTAGIRTGLYTSPHLVRVNERMQISVPSTPSEYSTAEVPATLGQAVLEVGLGGRLDATNVVDPVLSILTDIALDHQEYLGNTLAAITREKAGILRPNGILVTLPQHPEVNQTLGEIAAEMPNLRAISAAAFVPPAVRDGATVFDPRPTILVTSPLVPGMTSPGSESSRATSDVLAPNRYVVDAEGLTLSIDSPLRGHHQQRNIALAIAAALEIRNAFSYKISGEVIADGIRHTHWPGRLETLHIHGRTLLLDVAHNPAGAWTLRAAIAQLDERLPRTLLFSCLRDKDLSEMAQILFPLFDGSSTDPARHGDHVVLAPIDSPRAAHVDELLQEAHRLDVPAHAAPHLQAALSQALEITPEGGCVVATGSVYLVGAVRALVGARF